jgi:hypothetical protein
MLRHTSTRRQACLGSLALLLASGGKVHAASATGQVASDIVFVRVVGRWSSAGERGFMRLVLTRSRRVVDAVHLHIEWIEVAADNLATRTIASQEIEQVFAERLRINDYRSEQGQDETLVLFDVTRTTDGTEETWEMILRHPGDVRFNKASN